MNLTIREERNGPQTMLYLQGEVDAFTAPRLSERLTPIVLNPEYSSVTVNLAEVSYMDSTGIGVFIGALKASKQSGCQLQITQIPPRIDRLFQITGLKQILSIVSPEGGEATK
ncbi:MAG: STAS domain-containing protein [Clostridia bacterium]